MGAPLWAPTPSCIDDAGPETLGGRRGPALPGQVEKRAGKRVPHVRMWHGAPWNIPMPPAQWPAQPESGHQTEGSGCPAAQGTGKVSPNPTKQARRGSLGCGQAASEGRPLSPPACPHGPSPTTLLPAHPVPGDASDVTANNLDFNQEIALPPLPHLWSHRGENPDCSTLGRPQALPAEACCLLLPPTPPGRRRQGAP